MGYSMVKAGPLAVTLIPSSDNYIYLVQWDGGGAVVDPSVAGTVLQAAERQGVDVGLVLATHGHGDHVAGIPKLKRMTGAQVVGPRGARIPAVDREVGAGDRIALGPVEAEVMETPGHTRADITYYLAGAGAVFCGDTLFAGGCGRLFECRPEVMWRSLRRLRDLPDETRVFCGHEYTETNLAFAASVDPDNAVLRSRIDRVSALRQSGRPTIPSTIGEEKATNPFLRSDAAEIQRSLDLEGAAPVEVFAALRARKDLF